MQKQKMYLVAGSAGFLGSHLTRALIDRGHVVVGVDDLSTGSIDNVEELIDSENYMLIKGDICDMNSLLDMPDDLDGIYNFACPASPIHYQNMPIKTLMTNVVGVKNLLDLSLMHNCRILQSSTSEIYGDPAVSPQNESYVGHVNCYGPRACYTPDVEILTINGWKLFSVLSTEDGVATLNPTTHTLEYHKPKEIIEQIHSGDIYTFKNSNIDLSVTPNHKMYVEKRTRGSYELTEASQLTDITHTAMVKSVSRWNGKQQEYFYFPEETKNIRNSKHPIIDKVLMNDWLEFMGYFLSEGCVYNRERTRTVSGKVCACCDYRIQISQSEEKNPVIFNKIKNCLERLGINYSVSRAGNCYFVFHNKQISTYLSRFGKSASKFIPREFMDLPTEQLKILFGALMDGDGTKKTPTHKSRVYYTISKNLADDIQEIAMKLGYEGNIRYNKERKIYSMTCVETPTPAEYPIPTINKYTGKVYCVDVENHIILVRRDGKAVFCGNCYDEGKRAAEALLYDYKRIAHVDTRIIRIFNTYGPNMSVDDGRVVSNFIVQALRGDDITIYGDGQQSRSFCYVDDLIRGIIMFFEQDDIAGPMNLGNPGEFTMLELAKKVIEITKSSSRITYVRLPQDDPKQRRPDITLAKSMGWEPKIALDEGLRNAVQYFQSRLNNGG